MFNPTALLIQAQRQFRRNETKTFYVGPGGNDANDGLTVATRKGSVRGANRLARPGDRVIVLTLQEVRDLSR